MATLGTINVHLLNADFIQAQTQPVRKHQKGVNRKLGIFAIASIAYSIALTLELKQLREEVNVLSKNREEM